MHFTGGLIFLEKMTKNKCILLLAAILSITACSQKPKVQKPNIIMLLVDDLGWRDVGFMGSKFYETPNIDGLSKQSMVFTNAYAACAVCSPTRASIQTGRYPARIGVTDWIRARFQLPGDTVSGSPPPYQENGDRKLRTPSNPYWMGLDEVTIGQELKKSGYFTCHIGKWHLGDEKKYWPENRGYDINIGGSDMGQPVNYFDPYANKAGVRFPNLAPRKTGEYLVDRLADELVNVIDRHHDKPFFINMCYYAVHTPLMGKKDLVDKYEAENTLDDQDNPVYAAMIESVDDAVGKLLDNLKKNRLMDNTIIVFYSDNGGLLSSTSNKPLRAGKGYPYEGGIREPMFVYWKGHIEPGSKCDVPISSVDFLPTFCALTGTPLPDRTLDGADISPLFFKKPIKSRALFWHFPHYRGKDIVPYSIIRDGDWKLIKQYEGQEFQLFDLANDLGETEDLSGQKQNVVDSLNAKLEQWIKDTGAKMPVAKE